MRASQASSLFFSFYFSLKIHRLCFLWFSSIFNLDSLSRFSFSMILHQISSSFLCFFFPYHHTSSSNSPFKQQQQAHTNPIFFVHPGEGPNSNLVTPPLNGSNYLACNRSMHRALGTWNRLRSLVDQYQSDD